MTDEIQIADYRRLIVAWLRRKESKWRRTASARLGVASDAASFYAAAYHNAADGVERGEPERKMENIMADRADTTARPPVDLAQQAEVVRDAAAEAERASRPWWVIDLRATRLDDGRIYINSPTWGGFRYLVPRGEGLHEAIEAFERAMKAKP